MSTTITMPAPTAAQTAAATANALLNGGLTVTSASSGTISGTYPCIGQMMSAMQAELNAVIASGTTPAFADGTQSVSWPDRNGVGHAMNPAQFKEVALAVCNFVVACYLYGSGITSTAPSASVSIA
jgi:hypothetical protein